MNNPFEFDWAALPTGLISFLMEQGEGREEANRISGKIDNASYAEARALGYLPYGSLESHQLGCIGEGGFAYVMGQDPYAIDYVAADRDSKVYDADVLIGETLHEIRNTCTYGQMGIYVKPKDVKVNAQVTSIYVEADPDGKNPTGRIFFKGTRNARNGWTSIASHFARNGRDKIVVARPMDNLSGWHNALVNRGWAA